MIPVLPTPSLANNIIPETSLPADMSPLMGRVTRGLEILTRHTLGRIDAAAQAVIYLSFAAVILPIKFIAKTLITGIDRTTFRSVSMVWIAFRKVFFHDSDATGFILRGLGKDSDIIFLTWSNFGEAMKNVVLAPDEGYKYALSSPKKMLNNIKRKILFPSNKKLPPLSDRAAWQIRANHADDASITGKRKRVIEEAPVSSE